MENILDSIKKLLGIDKELTQFDQDVAMDINTSLLALNQIGVGPSEGFSIKDYSEEWTDLIGDRKDLEAVKTYVYLKTRLLFDPPQSGFLVDAIKAQISEIEWRLMTQV